MWIETKIDVISTRNEDLGISNSPVLAKFLFNTDSLVSVWECLKKDPNDEIDPNRCIITLLDADSYTIHTSYEEVKMKANIFPWK